MKSEYFASNRINFSEMLEDNSLAILLSGDLKEKTGDQHYKFTPNRNFYYLTGIEQDKSIVVFFKKGNVTKEYLFLEKITPEMEKWIGKKLTNEEAEAISGIKTIDSIANFESILNQLLNKVDNVYLDLFNIKFGAKKTEELILANKIKEYYPCINIRKIDPIMVKLRLIKNEWEIELIKKAIEITKYGIIEIIKNCKPNINESKLANLFEYEIKNRGASETAFNTIMASGINATVLHYNANNCDLKDGELLLLDLGAEYNYYAADITRTIPINGKYEGEAKYYYEQLLAIQKEIIQMIKPGVSMQELNDKTNKLISKLLLDNKLIEKEEDFRKYYMHSVGHFLGLDTHDVGIRDAILQAGMVITIEPGIYIPEKNLGIRIEDDILVTSDGHINLSESIPKEISDIEELMINIVYGEYKELKD